jgi:hypothetical protein
MKIKTQVWVRRPYFGNQWATGNRSGCFPKFKPNTVGLSALSCTRVEKQGTKIVKLGLRNLIEVLARFSFTIKNNSSNLYYRPKIWATLLTPANRSYCGSYCDPSRESSSSSRKKLILVTFHYRSIWSPIFQLRLVCWPSERERVDSSARTFRPSKGH